MTTPADSWYRMSAMRRLNAPVRVLRGGSIGTAVLMRDTAGDAPRWVEPVMVKGQRQLRDITGPLPELWQPLVSGSWADPLPAPVVLSESGRFVSIGRVTFSATEAAAEMEADRETARAQHRDNHLEDADRSLPWWRDASIITYSAPGAITPREAEGRTMRALYFLAGESSQTTAARRVRVNAEVLEQLRRAADLLNDTAPDLVPYMAESPADTPERLITAMRWVCELMLSPAIDGDRAFRILDARARNRPLSWGDISAEEHVSRARAKQIHDAALRRVTAIANTGTPNADREIAALQQRNRNHANAHKPAVTGPDYTRPEDARA